MLKKYFIPGVIVIVAVIVLTIFGTSTYFKSAEKTLKAQYNTEIKANAATIAKLQAQNTAYYTKLNADSIALAKSNAEITNLKQQNQNIQHDLIAAQTSIKNYTDGQAIQYFVDYSKATDSKMLVVGKDTSVVVSSPSVRKVDSIFVEHHSFGLQIASLNQIILKQDGSIGILKDKEKQYQSILLNKDSELNLSKTNCGLEKAKIQMDADKYKMQRNKARWLIAAPVTIGVAAVIVKFFVLK
jgi:hypothetical protein